MWFKLLFNAVWAILQPVIITIVAMVTKESLQFILETVTVLSTTDLTNEEKNVPKLTRL